MLIQNKYEIGAIVFLKTDSEQLERIVTSIQVNPGELIYRLNCGAIETWHYEFELCREKDLLKSLMSES